MRTASVSERIAARFKDIQKKSTSALSGENTSLLSSEPDEVAKVDKGKGKAVIFEASPMQLNSPLPISPPLPPKVEIPSSPMPPMAAEPMLLAGLSLPPVAVSQLLTKAASELNLRPVRFPLLGEYKDCFTGDEFVAWLKENVQGLGGSLDRAEQAAKDLTERDGLLRRIGELGNDFEHSEEAFYQFRPKARQSMLAPQFLLTLIHSRHSTLKGRTQMPLVVFRRSSCNQINCSSVQTLSSTLSLKH